MIGRPSRPRNLRTLQPKFWHNRWRLGQIGFHQSAVDRHLGKYWPQMEIPGDGRVFVPLCGKSLDLLWLEQHHSVAGVEISAVALESFCLEHGIAARRRILRDFDVYEADQLHLYRGDFFALSPELLGRVSAVFDRAALISWAPEQRAAYVAHMTALTRPGTQTLLITVEYPQAQMGGPPFSVEADVGSPNSAVADSQPQSSRSADIALPPPAQGRPPIKR